MSSTSDPTPDAVSTPRGPGRPARQPDEAGEVRERLLDAATELAVERGFEGTGIREIAARADVSSGMIAYYFGDRQGLYDAMFRRALDRAGERIRALLEDPDRPGTDRLDELVQIQVEAITADPWLPQLIVRDVLARSDSPSRQEFAQAMGRGPLMLMIGWLEEEQQRGILRPDFDPRLMAMTLISLTAFPFLMLPVLGGEIGIELDESFPARLLEHNQKFLAHGLRARSEEDR